MDDAGAKSRAEVLARALRRELRRQEAERDAEIYAATEMDSDEERQWVAWASRNASEVWASLD